MMISIEKLIFLSLCLTVFAAKPSVEPEFLDALLASGQDEQFAELLGIGKHLVRPDNSEQRSEGSIFNQVSSLGDIVLTEEQERNAIDFNVNGGSRWPNGRVPYAISTAFTSSEKKIITDAINDFNSKVTNVRLDPKRRSDKDYVYVMDGQGCWSYLGRTGGQQALSLQINGCLNSGTIQHEFMHAIGFTHEHNRGDRDNYVKVLWNNIPDTWHSQYKQVGDYGWENLLEYDYYSVMHYPIWAPETYKDAFEIPDGIDRNRLGQRDGVTPTDIDKCNLLYS